MNKISKKRPAAKKGAASVDERKGGDDSPAVVVGVGAEAGGTKSLKRFFSKMPAGHGLAFVLIYHIIRGQKSISVKSLKNQTVLAVVEAKEGMPLLTDRIHVIPPDKFLNISGGKLTLQEPVLCNGLRMPIDHFFCSLAVDQRRRSIGVLLSGKGSDGTLGLSEIRAAGGKTLVEDPASSAYPYMPQSAIDAGVAGKVMPADAMAEAVTEIAGQLATEPDGLAEQQGTDPDLRAVLDILRAKVGHDFRCYKPGTLLRRIKRRISLAKIHSMDVYARFLKEHPEEVGLLQKDLLIGVTDFFRQPQAWETLEEKVIATIVEGAQPGSEIRVWVPGCSTGKEAYSLAMVLAEQVEKSGKKVAVQIFATDSDLAALATARSGAYTKKDFGENVSPERLKRFFVRKDGRYQVAKNIREQIVFAPQNITADPPFSRLDLVSCRNLLIYLDQNVQKKIIAIFHFALREGGFLFLGTAETVGDREELFEPVSKKWRIYRRIGVGHRVAVEIPVRPTAAPLPEDYLEAARAFAKAPSATPPSRMSLTSGAQHMLLDRFAPACVMIDRKLQVLYVHGAVEDYLTFPPGELTTRVVDMVREGLRARLRGAIAKCLQSNKSVSVTARVRRGNKSIVVKSIVSPLRYPREIDGLLLITFEDYRIPVAKTSRDVDATGDIRHLEDELKITREELQSTIEQLENSNDELKASNEEVTAANEELQSANEELETSKEELQSLNEELNTINVRLHEKVDELEGVNNDVVNLLSSTSIATVFLDRELKVKRYTPASTRLMSLIPTDTGRHIADILLRFSDETLLDDARLVLAELTPLSKEVQADDGRWYIRRITPYRTQDDRIEGVVITFVDVADLKEAEEALRQLNIELEQRVNDRTAELRSASLYARSLIEASLDPLVTISPEGRITDVNEATEQVTGRTRKELIGRDFSDYFTDPDSAQAGYRKVLAEGHVRDYPLTIRHMSGNTTDVLYNATVYRNQAGEVQGVFAAARDVTELKRAEAALREINETLEQRVAERTAELHESQHRLAVIVDSIADGFFAIDRAWRFTHVNDAALAHFRKTREDVIGHMFFEVFPEAHGGIFETEYRRAIESGEPVHFESPSLVSDLAIEIHAYPGPENLTVLFRDITEKHRMVTALREAHERAEWLARFPEENPNPVMRVSADGSALYCNQASMNTPGCDCRVGSPLPAPLQHFLEVALATGEEVEQEMEMGSRFYSVSIVPIPGEGYANIYGRDITARKQAEEALRESKAQLDLALLSAHMGRWYWDIINGKRYFDNQVCHLLGIDPATFTGAEGEFFGAVHPDDRATIRAALSRTIEHDEPYEVEYRVVWSDRSIHYIGTRGMLVRDDAGQPVRINGIIWDITERKGAEKALQESDERLKRAQEIAHLGSWELDLVENRLTWSDEVYRLFGLQPQEFGATYEAFLERVHPEDRTAVDAAYAGSLRENRDTYEIEHRVIRKDTGQIRIVHEKCEHFRNSAGNIIRSVGMVHDITERKRAEQELQTALQRLHALVAGMHSSILLVGEGRIEMANQAFCDYFGLQESPGELVGLTPHELIDKIKDAYLHPDEQVKRIWEIARGRQPIIGEEIPMRDGRTSLRDFIPIYADGKSYGLLWHHIDITERKQAEEALRDSEARFRLLSATAGRLLHAEDPQAVVEDLCRNVMAHLNCQTFFNFLVDEKAGRLHLNACAGIPEEDARAIEWLDYGVAICGCVAQEGRRIIAEDILHTPDMRTELIKSFGIQAYCCHPLMSQGRLIGTLSFGTKTRAYYTPDEVELMRLVTDQVAVAMQRKQTEQMILHAKEEWERTFDAVPDLIAILDDRHRILRANKAMAERLGVAVESCVGESCHKAVHGLDRPPEFCPHTLAMADGREHMAEVHEDRLGGDFLVSATPLTDERGRHVGSVHVARDITKRKQAEQILRDRTAELEAANRELESFSYSVSHDLRAPLRAIDGYARMILKKEGDKFDEETMRKFNVIRSSSQMMGQLIDDILTLSRVVKKQLSASQLEMGAVIREVWKELETINPERNMKLIVCDVPAAYGDKTLIKQVYANLLSNAVKFTKYRDPALIETGGYIEGDENVYYIRDNGVGFEMEYYDKLFGIFQRLHKPDEFEGTGVGLATVERIVQRHGGRAWAEGKVNQGATFYFTLPRRR